jgi:hypothetical protein
MLVTFEIFLIQLFGHPSKARKGVGYVRVSPPEDLLVRF